MSKTKFLAARELILEHYYDAARAVLKTMPNHVLAQEWLYNLENIVSVESDPVEAAMEADSGAATDNMLAVDEPESADESTVEIQADDEPADEADEPTGNMLAAEDATTTDNSTLPISDGDPLPLESLSDMLVDQKWEACMLVASYNEAENYVIVVQQRRPSIQQVILKSSFQTSYDLLVQAATQLGKEGWQVAGMDTSDKGNPFFVMKRPIKDNPSMYG